MINLCFKKADFHNIFEALIALRSWSRIIHVEIQFLGLGNQPTWRINPDNKPAVRWEYSVDYSDANTWIVVPFKLTDQTAVRQWCNTQVGKSYDFVGLFNFIFPAGEDDDDDLFCSEGAVYALQHDIPGDFSNLRGKLTKPSDLYKYVTNQKNNLGTMR